MPMTLDAYWQIWSDSAATVLQQIAGAPISATPQPPAAADEQAAVCVRFSCGKGLSGQHSFLLASGDAISLARLFTGEAAVENATLTDEHREALAELLRQVAGVAADALKAKISAEVELRCDGCATPEQNAGARCALQLSGGSLGTVLVHMQADANLAASLQGTQQAPADAPSADPPRDGNLALLMDIQLDVRLRFGRREMLVRDIVELTSGSVVELDRNIDEPAELLLGGKVVARGQVVIVDGNYGLRVTEIGSPHQRLAYLQ